MWGRRNWKVHCDQMRWARLRRIRLHWITTTTRDWSFPRNEQKKSDYKNSDHTKNCLKSLNFFIFCLNYVSMDHFSVRGDEDHTGYNFWGFLLRHFVITYCLFIYNLAVYLKNKTISFVTKHNQIFIYEQLSNLAETSYAGQHMPSRKPLWWGAIPMWSIR